MPAPKNNKHAAKPADKKVNAAVIVRGTPAERAAWKCAASGGKWNSWARAALNDATL